MSSAPDSSCLAACNSIRTLAFLIGELKEVATDQRSGIILGEMEKALARTAADVDVAALQAKVASLQAELDTRRQQQLDEIWAKISAAIPTVRKSVKDDDASGMQADDTDTD